MKLYNLRHNHLSGYYEAKEKGITYQMEHSQMDSLKHSNEASIADWYLSLPIEFRKKVKRTGNLPGQKDSFYPDQQFED